MRVRSDGGRTKCCYRGSAQLELPYGVCGRLPAHRHCDAVENIRASSTNRCTWSHFREEYPSMRLNHGRLGRTRTSSLMAGFLVPSMLAYVAHGQAQTTQTFPPYPLPPGASAQSVSVTVHGDSPRTFDLTTTAPQRDSAPSSRHITESGSGLNVRTANPLFDALLAQAMDDIRLDSVTEIRDAAYESGASIHCDCFQTGEKWAYVWTRDLSYSADLSLALLDPARTVNSLAFKTSPFRRGLAPAGLPAASCQIVQDTGSGGSWPVSTDRVTWALGADAVLDTLTGEARAHFARLAYRALRGTLEADRAAVFDADDGLYRGEQSFLDWRDQTYAPYVLEDLTQIAQSKALSTNVVHYRALRLGARLAGEMADGPVADRYSRWAEALKKAINERFWLDDQGLYASITTADTRAAPVGPRRCTRPGRSWRARGSVGAGWCSRVKRTPTFWIRHSRTEPTPTR